MSSKTLFQCFNEAHPPYEAGNKDKTVKYNASASSHSVKGQHPPDFLVTVSSTYWVRKAEQQLPNVKRALEAGHIAPRMPYGLATEQDVVILSNLYLVIPLMAALEALYPGDELTTYSEYQVEGLRVDQSIRTKFQSDGQATMLIEYKRCWYIRESEFAAASFATEREGKEQHDIDGITSSWKGSQNATKFIKQAAAYYVRSNCRYIALCDYQHLVLIRFKGNGDLSSADGTIVPRALFRKSLLGFAMEACEAVGLKKYGAAT
jgi:hypothetical protein